MTRSARARVLRSGVARGRILAVKWGMNPNSSSLGVDVTFLLVGATAVAMFTPIIGALIRMRRTKLQTEIGRASCRERVYHPV